MHPNVKITGMKDFNMGIIRFLLAFIVIISHSPVGIIPKLPSGLAVQSFYVISGFLIQLAIVKYYNATDKKWFFNFYKSRILRIMPLYWLFTLLMLLVFGSPFFLTLLTRHDTTGIIVYIVTNSFLIGQDLLRLLLYTPATQTFSFLPASNANLLDLVTEDQYLGSFFSVNHQTWSISIELLFYAMAPLILLRTTKWVVILLCLSIMFRAVLIYNGYVHNFYFHGIIFSELALFLSGALGARFYKMHFSQHNDRSIKNKFQDIFLYKKYVVFIFLLLASCLIFKIRFMQPTSTGVPIAYWIMLLSNIVLFPFVFHILNKNKLDRFIGELSYPLYISHVFVIKILEKNAFPDKYFGLYAVIISTVLSVIILYSIEKPIDKMRHAYFLKKSKATGVDIT